MKASHSPRKGGKGVACAPPRRAHHAAGTGRPVRGTSGDQGQERESCQEHTRYNALNLGQQAALGVAASYKQGPTFVTTSGTQAGGHQEPQPTPTIQHRADEGLRVCVDLVLLRGLPEHLVKLVHLAQAARIVRGELIVAGHINARLAGVASAAQRPDAAVHADGALQVLDHVVELAVLFLHLPAWCDQGPVPCSLEQTG
eukprot:1141888-Pelagomonas_calceolata.AAC.4